MHDRASWRVYGADLGHGPKPWLVVSDNARNRVLDTVLAVRLTTTNLEHIASAVKLKPADSPLVGWIRVDDLEQLYANELGGEWGALSGPTMREVDLTLHQGFRHPLVPSRSNLSGLIGKTVSIAERFGPRQGGWSRRALVPPLSHDQLVAIALTLPLPNVWAVQPIRS